MEANVKVKVIECELACELDRTNAAVAATTSSSRTGTGNLTRGISCLPKRRRATNNEVKELNLDCIKSVKTRHMHRQTTLLTDYTNILEELTM